MRRKLPDGPAATGAADPPSLDRFVGTLLGGAVGDALGYPYEGRDVDYGVTRSLRYGGRHPGGISDDTQLTLVVGECLLANGWLDPVDLSGRLVAWLPHGIGAGHATTSAVVRLAQGQPWYRAGSPSAGNGAAMRVAPIALLRWNDPVLRRCEAMLSALPTHHDALAVASTVVMAEAVSWLLVCDPDAFDHDAFIGHLVDGLDGLAATPLPERRDPRSRTTLGARLQEVPALLALDPAHAIGERLWSGAFVLESLPAAFWCFLRHPRDPAETLRTAISVGHDADTVAALAGTLAGALNGARQLPAALIDGLPCRDEIVTLAEHLWQSAVGDDNPPASPAN
jgi:ADP-ribosyl-[dinitrogen reductase] hydrolase